MRRVKAYEPRCPRCGGFIPNFEHRGEYPGAVSRVDNMTEICSPCGTDEALGPKREVMGYDGWKNPPNMFDADIAEMREAERLT